MPKVKKPSSAVHPNSRKAMQMARAEHRNVKLVKNKEEVNNKVQIKLKKLKWFRDNVDCSKIFYTSEEAHELIEKYFKRFCKEEKKSEELKGIKGRHNNERMSHEYKMKFLLEQEKRDYETSGLEIPNLCTKNTFTFFSTWNGEVRYLPRIEMTTVTKSSNYEIQKAMT